MNNKFENKEGIIIIKDFDTAISILKDSSFVVPDLLSFLDKLSEASNIDLSTLRLFTTMSPFFLEGEKHQYLRSIGQVYLGTKYYEKWLPFFQNTIDKILNRINSLEEFDLIQELNIPIFTELLKPYLGIYSNNEKDFDKKAIVLQRLIEPMLSINKLKLVNSDLKELIDSLDLEKTHNQDSIFKDLLDNNIELSLDEKKAYIIVLYAAIAPLAQTIINIIVYLCENKPNISKKDFLNNIDYYIWKCAAPIFIHRIAVEDKIINNTFIKKGNTLLIDISTSIKNHKNNCPMENKNFAFGHGKHLCLGAFISRSLISEIVPRFLDTISLKILSKEKDKTNHIANSYMKIIVKNIKES